MRTHFRKMMANDSVSQADVVARFPVDHGSRLSILTRTGSGCRDRVAPNKLPPPFYVADVARQGVNDLLSNEYSAPEA